LITKRATLRNGIVVSLALAASLSLTGNPRRAYTGNEKAAFLQPYLIEFLRPGLQIQINSATIGSDGTITTVYTVTDPVGLPLDTAGVYTPGPISLSFVAGYIPADAEQYTTYTTRSATGAVSGTVTQAGADSGGTTTQIASGQYQYVFRTKAPAGFDVTATHTIGIYGSRNLTAFGATTNYASATFNFVPNGAAVTKTRDVVTTATCDTCHDQLSAHGGSRRVVTLCVMCHTPQTMSPGTGATVDFKVLIHKLHMGSQLPSVIAGGSYKIVNSFGTSDFSTVVFPADPRRCQSCHDLKSGAKQATAYLTKPTRAACGSCHDDVDFSTGANHAAGVQLDDTQCSTCHAPQGAIDFDASIAGAHVVPTESSLLSGLSIAIQGVTNGLAGQKPVVTFTVTDKNGAAIPLSALSSISFTMTGPTFDYGNTSFGSDVTTVGYVTESAARATCSGANCSYPFTHSVPAGATGTFAIGVEARRSESILPGTPKAQTVQYGAKNQVKYFSVDGSVVTPRRTVVQTSNCNNCHVALSLHGTLRNQTEYCVFCHNPSDSDFPTRPAATIIAERSKPNQGINFNLMVHRIHTGDNLPALGKSYTIIGFGGSINDFTDVRYPAMSPTGSAGDTRKCSICHVNNSQLTLPLGRSLVTDPQGPVNPVPAITGSCVGCHADIPTAAHALANTDSLGESCTVCHRSGSAYAVDQVHAQY
jgi:OmcA/MtrC family decaheme c-type cytochrome